MMIIGCDFHPSFQQIAYVDQETGEYEERRLTIAARRKHFTGHWQAGRFASEWKQRGMIVGFTI
jgi:hypothetical protein